MNKEQLIKLKKMLFDQSCNKEYREANLDMDDGCYNLSPIYKKSEILSKLNTEGAIIAIMSNFESAIKYYAKKNIDFDTMTITPSMFPYVSEKWLQQYLNVENDSNFDIDYCESEIMLKDDMEFLGDIVSIDLYDLSVMNNQKKVSLVGESESILNYDAYNRYIVSIKDLKDKLLEEGLVLKGVNDVRDILSNIYKGSITIEFEQKKNTVQNKNMRIVKELKRK